ncbi:MAG: HNH endonuclease [Sulfurovum sp.]|nr:MAG: HNH endonuclease [Sulfurovum sp.]
MQIEFNCDMCGKLSSDRKSHYKRKKRHFCSMSCYAEFRKTKLPKNEQHAWKGGVTPYEAHRRYVKKNPKRISHLKARRYAREKGAEGNHTLEEWQYLCIKHDNKCVFCREAKKLTKDHIVPLSKGGSDYITNIQPMCRNCNSKKHIHIYEYPELLEAKS